MKIGNKKLFLDKPKLYQMVNLRIIGYAETSLATLFGCDRSSIYAQLKKYNIINLDQVYDIQRISSKIIPHLYPSFKSQWEVVNGERINLGKNYKDYLKEAY